MENIKDLKTILFGYFARSSKSLIIRYREK